MTRQHADRSNGVAHSQPRRLPRIGCLVGQVRHAICRSLALVSGRDPHAHGQVAACDTQLKPNRIWSVRGWTDDVVVFGLAQRATESNPCRRALRSRPRSRASCRVSKARGLLRPPISSPSPVGLEPCGTNVITVAAIEMRWRSRAPSNTTASMKVNHGLASCFASPATGHAHHRFGQVNDLQAHFAEPIPGTDQVVQARSRLAAVRDRKLGVVAHARTLIRISKRRSPNRCHQSSVRWQRVVLREQKRSAPRSFPNRR